MANIATRRAAKHGRWHDPDRLLLSCVLLVGLACTQRADADEFFVAPNGRPQAAGTQADPRELTQVLAGNSLVKPGDTVWLLPGRYPAPTRSGKRTAFVSLLQGTPQQPIVLRSLPGRRTTLDGSLIVRGGYTTYWGFEVADSTFTDKTEQGAQGHETSITVFGAGTKFINLDVHDGVQGFGFWSPARDAEIYGCLIHDFGYKADDRGHGHAIYAQNETGTKRIVDNLMFRGHGWNVHAYTQMGRIDGFHIEGNISFSAGTRVKGQVADNILVSGYPPADRITLIDNYTYHPGGVDELGAGWRPTVRLDSYRDEVNGACTVRNNVFAGARGLQMGQWHEATVKGNLFWGAKVMASVRPPEGNFSNYDWDDNTYVLTGQESPFVVRRERSTEMDFDSWRRHTGFDRHSNVRNGNDGRPTGTWVYVRPNRYEPGRAHVAVYNWERRPEVDVDLSGVLKKSDHYEIRNVQADLYGEPLTSGTFDGRPVRVPTLRSAVSPEFEAMLVTLRSK